MMELSEEKISVVYLCRYGKDYFIKLKKFLESTRFFKSGLGYSLNIIFKNKKTIPDKVTYICDAYNAKLYFFEDNGLDWGAYIRFANLDDSDFILFLNSNSKVLADNWLLNLYKPLKFNNVKISGATGSFSSSKTRCLPLKFIFYCPIKFCKYLLGFSLDLIFKDSLFDSFPSIHIRSNAFMIKRLDFLEYVNTQKFPTSKLDVHCLENGKNSLSKYFLKKNHKIGVVDKNGVFYLPSKWKESKTFKYSNQENLLISDNQTNYYENHKKNYISKLIMNFITWG